MEVTLIDHMGSDLTVVNAARVSFNKESDWEWDTIRNTRAGIPDTHLHGFPHLSDNDKKLVNYLAKHNHFTPFTHVQITLRQKMPIFVARQFAKHTVGFSTNEVSRRYVDDPPEFFVPKEWRGRPVNAKQGSSDEVITHLKADSWEDWGGKIIEGREIPLSESYPSLMKQIAYFYQKYIESGVAPEQARMILPQSTYTEMYTTGSLMAWARAYKLRSDPHAQIEIQDLAKEWNRIITGLPELEYSWRALTE